MHEEMKMKMSDTSLQKGNAALTETHSHLWEYDCVRMRVCMCHNTLSWKKKRNCM